MSKFSKYIIEATEQQLNLKDFYNDIFSKNNKLLPKNVEKYTTSNFTDNILNIKTSDIINFSKEIGVKFSFELDIIGEKIFVVLWWDKNQEDKRKLIKDFANKHKINIVKDYYPTPQIALEAFYSHFLILLLMERKFISNYNPNFNIKDLMEYILKRNFYFIRAFSRSG